MTYRYVSQLDLDGTWSVREVANNTRAIYRGKLLAGLTEKVAVFNAKKLNDRSGDQKVVRIVTTRLRRPSFEGR
jgi:hypothetical protein